MACKDIAEAEFVQSADMHMDIEANNPTNVDIFYLFSAKPFSIRSFTNRPCMALENTRMDKLDELHKDMHSNSMDASSPTRRPCRGLRTSILVHNQRMVFHIHIADKPTTILEAMETLRKPKDYTGNPIAICRILCRSQTPIRVSAMAVNS
jgi:hypothetical protein